MKKYKSGVMASVHKTGQALNDLRAAIDLGDASGVAKGDVFARVRKAADLPKKK